ncbi:MAG TPA: DUF494 family protein [Bacteroidota bacterium]|nr:DUF494 family protein [Bacteroidota bacterium]
MHERIVEIIVYLVGELNSSKQLSEVDVASLTRDGYTQTEISTAFSWVFERISAGQQLVTPTQARSDSHRVLNDVEKMVISTESFGYLLQCHQLGLLTNNDIESIVERIMAAGFSLVGLAEIKSFVAGVLFDSDNPSGSGRISLSGNDSIH